MFIFNKSLFQSTLIIFFKISRNTEALENYIMFLFSIPILSINEKVKRVETIGYFPYELLPPLTIDICI